MRESITEQIRASRDLKTAILEDAKLIEDIRAAATCVVTCLKAGGKVLLAGNGGSAAEAQHIAAELVGRYRVDRPSLAAIALSTDTSIVTAIGNDYGFEHIFSRQIESIGAPGDMFIGISTSGRSPNVLKALATAKSKSLVTVGMTGADGAAWSMVCDHCLVVPSRDTPRIQEAHITLGHVLCAFVEDALFGRGWKVKRSPARAGAPKRNVREER